MFRRYDNQLTRSERSRLDNTIDNALFKIDRFCCTRRAEEIGPFEDEVRSCGSRFATARELSRSRSIRPAAPI